MDHLEDSGHSVLQGAQVSRTGSCGEFDRTIKMKTLAQRRQSAPSLVISKALGKSRTISRESCLSPISPESCPLVQSFLCPARVFVADSHVQLKAGLQTQERHLFLFSDILVIAKSKSTSHFKLKNRIRICEMWTASCMEEVCEGSTSPDCSFVMGWPTTNCVATFSSTEEKERWLFLIKSRIKEEKEKDDTITIPLKIFAKDIGNCAYSKILAVSSTDSATDVIKVALQQFGLSGCVKDYQLWVSSSKDEAPYPLIGHEYPFSIKMSHMREPASQSGAVVVRESASPQQIQGALLLEQLPLETRCQFILKPSHMAMCQQLLEPSQKPFKRKRSLINWAFWRGSGNQLDSLPLSPTSPNPGRLFGLPLSVVCEDNSLPKPVMDMLSFLFQEGPFTRGIFRRSANAKACRELRDKLNSGAEVLLNSESIFVMAAVFKDFLRNIPGSLLFSELYNKWVNVMDQGNDEERILAIQRLMEQLPKENMLLLRHLFGVLHCIEQHSEENQMNAFNLAVCIAPSMLWAPAPSSPETESEGTKKVSIVVQFVIENCSKIFGEDVTSLFGSLPQKCNGSDNGSDVSSFQMNDSSYDSLENELNDDADCPFPDLGRKDKQDNRSRDSVITLSDCDLDQPETEPIHLQLPPLSRPRRFTPAVRQSRPRRECLDKDSLYPRGARRHRRCSEPAIALLPSGLGQHLEKHDTVVRKASYDAVITKVEDGCVEQLHCLQLDGLMNLSPNTGRDLRTAGNDRRDSQNISRLKLKQPPPLRLNLCPATSCSSLSSPGTSPSGSSMSSLDSAFSQYSDYSVFTPTEPCFPSGTPRAQGDSSPRFSTSTHSSDLLSPGLHSRPASCSSPKMEKDRLTSSPKEGCDWALQRSCHSLHPNTWLKKDRSWSLHKKERSCAKQESVQSKSPDRLPLSSESPLEVSGQEHEQTHKESATVAKRQHSKPPSYQEAILQINRSKPPFYQVKQKGLTVKELRQLHEHGGSKEVVQQTGAVCLLKPPALRVQKSPPARNGPGQLPQTVFFGQSSSLSVRPMRRQQSQSFTLAEECLRSPAARRSSEPSVGCGGGGAVPSDLERHRLLLVKDKKDLQVKNLQDHKLKVSDVDQSCNGLSHKSETNFCLSPSTTKAVKDYFSCTDVENCLKKSQEVANAVIQGKKEWHSKRCSDPKFEDFEQMFFAEESYV
ncbi:rho GTPase-activating protein 20 isoform X2 [Amia ocellicauda]|uniref:rho GTPase-activating protein 20 isoform X2 n=1 Tax=Amia ocellicauda TaxID=2972642 RepID=UPI003463E468